ncbi:MAG: Gfo/Idh/MocA family oxidoreductase [Verrucomicrobia bacterium]|nr:Gfo/Idh/MocA family oxidoreductase [Verrucomicrobiota bacterium]
MNTQDQFISRRSFLRRVSVVAAGIAGTPHIIPSSVFGANAPGNRITVGFIGCGRQAFDYNIPDFIKTDGVQAVAVCDVDFWRMAQAVNLVEKLSKRKGCKAHRDFRELLADKGIDVVMISTQDHWHVPMAVAAVRAGKDVALEKPVTRYIDEGRLLANEVAKHKRVFRVDSEFRSLEPFHRVAGLVRNGRIGKLHAIRTGSPEEQFPNEPAVIAEPPAELDYDLWLGPAPKVGYMQKRVHTPHNVKSRPGWMRNLDYSDGMICNWGAHLNDIGLWGAGLERTGPVEIKATGKFHDDKDWNVLERFDARYRFANGMEFFYQMGTPHVRFEGDRGWIQVDWPGRIQASAPALLKDKISPGEIQFPLKGEKQDFIDAVRSRGRTLEDEEVGQRVTSLCHLAHISIQLGGATLAWDPAKEIFLNNNEANKLTKRPPMRAPWSFDTL